MIGLLEDDDATGSIVLNTSHLRLPWEPDSGQGKEKLSRRRPPAAFTLKSSDNLSVRLHMKPMSI